MNNKDILIFDKKELFTLDKNFILKDIDPDSLESEIEQIIFNLWNSTCSIEKELRPLFFIFSSNKSNEKIIYILFFIV